MTRILAAMDVSPCSTSSQSPCWEGTHNMIWYFVCNCLRVNISENSTMCTMRGSYMLSATPLIMYAHLRKVMKYSSSNVCLFFQHSILIPVLRGTQHLSFCMVQVESRPWRNGHGLNHTCVACRCCQKPLPVSICIKGRLWNTPAAVNVSYCSIASNFLRWKATYPKSASIFYANWESTSAAIAQCDHK